MHFSFIVCNDTEILDRHSRQVLGRIRRPRWYGDFWRATVAGRTVEEPTQTQLLVALQKRLDRLSDPADPLEPLQHAGERNEIEDIPRPRRPVPQKPTHVKPTPPPAMVPPPLQRPVNYAMVRRVRVFAERKASGTEAVARTDETGVSRALK